MTIGRHALTLAASALAFALAAPLVATAEQRTQLVGTVTDFHGKYGMVVRDIRGALVSVTLHQGTIIKPLGLRLERGMVVTIIGQGEERTFAAAEINTPYQLPRLARLPRLGDDAPRQDLSGRGPGDARWSEVPGDQSNSGPPVREPATPIVINPH